MQSNKKIYWILFILALGGYGWLAFQSGTHAGHGEGVSLCMFKNITGLPCPGCGITRSLLLLIDGHILESILLNPLGILAALALVFIPVWMLVDVLTKKFTLGKVYALAEQKLKSNRYISVPLITLLLLNWCWSILKDI